MEILLWLFIGILYIIMGLNYWAMMELAWPLNCDELRRERARQLKWIAVLLWPILLMQGS